jgi:predicted dehydrogenase
VAGPVCRARGARTGYRGWVTDDLAPADGRPPLRFGLAGTGYWAQVAHARALASVPGVELAAVWGRNPEAAAALAGQHQATAHSDFGAFLADVDAVAFSIPPDVQAELAARAALAGKHLLLEKPVATELARADALVQAVTEAGVASVVFFTARFQPEIRAWLGEVAGQQWTSGHAIWLGSAVSPASPFNTPWRRAKGGLWDLGPHALSVLSACLGPIVSVLAAGGPADVSHLILQHDGGATSTVTVTVRAPEALDNLELQVWGDRGSVAMPTLGGDPVIALRNAIGELARNIRSGVTGHPCDVRFGRDITAVLAAAQEQIAARGPDGGPHRG